MKSFQAILIAAVGCLMAVVCLLWIPEWMANQYYLQEAKDWAAQVTANRAMLVNLLGGIAVSVTIYFTYQNFKVAQENLKVAQDKLLTDALSTAYEQLGHASMSVRIGGIHTLARIAKSSESDYYPIMHVLTGHLRHNYRQPSDPAATAAGAPGVSRCPVEVQTILSIVGSRYWPIPDGYSLDLSYIDVADAWLPGADLRSAYFWFARLENWNLCDAKLADADFKSAVMTGCDFTNADLKEANLDKASITDPKGLTNEQLDSAVNVDIRVYEMIALLSK